ncbi:MAG: hypothetical protein HYT37_00640 [Candidatus Sungbacteria bacterium]|nr:hypothetical protein [Candidatus Sungbacteria bacterium]
MESHSFEKSGTKDPWPEEKLMSILGRIEFLVMQGEIPDDFISGESAIKKIERLNLRFKEEGQAQAVMREAMDLAKKAKEYLNGKN